MFTLIPPTVWIETDAGPAVDLGEPWVEPEKAYLVAGAITPDIDVLQVVLHESHDGDSWKYLANFQTPVENGITMIEFRRTKRYVRAFIGIETVEVDQSAALSAIITRSS